MKLYIKRQWKRSTSLGFLRRMRDRLFGRKCYTIDCVGAMRRIDQWQTIDAVIVERWHCFDCLAETEERY